MENNNNFNNQPHDNNNTSHPSELPTNSTSVPNYDHQQHPYPTPQGPRRRRQLRSIIIALILIIVAISVVDEIVVRFAGRGATFTTMNFNANDVQQLDVRLTNMIINIQSHNENQIRVVYTPPSGGRHNNPRFEHNTATGRLEISEPRARRFGIRFNFGISRTQGSVTVYIPENANINAANLRTTNGRVRIDGGGIQLSRDINVRTTNGTVDAQRFTAETVYLRSTNGAVTLRDVSASKDITARTTNGRVGADGVTARDLTLNTTNGAIALDNSTIHELLTARTTNGGINLTNVDADTNRANLRTTNGRVNIN